ncbi:MAG: radical SAM protein [Candidatus Aureabacteria bacterium]|nr:radical SAM protein [Candidatus Auribacterota bacterium]MCK5655222.1 radical SAM protein [Candidatus Auribacterota bacterium]
MSNFAYCNSCRQTVPAEYVVRGSNVYLAKKCPKCGMNETLISSDVDAYKKKFDFMGDVAYESCGLNCLECEHKVPNIAFVELTNRCNMNCPICITNVPSMGFEFEPDMEYFKLIFEDLSKLDPKPSIQLFGGEPTVREDLFDIIRLAKSYGLSVRVVTNGLKLADKKYCEKLIEEGVSILISFDGFNKKMYEMFRGMPEALDLKLKALENLAQRKSGKVILMTVASKEQDSEDLKKLFDYCVKNKKITRGIFIMPLAHMWSPERLDYNPERTTPEDVEHMVDNAVGGGLEFVPLGSLDTKVFNKVLNLKDMPFVGVHPNCESITVLVSDGERLLPVSKFLKKGLFGLINDLRNVGKDISGQKEVGFLFRIKVYTALIKILFCNFDFGAAVGQKGVKAFFKWIKIAGRLISGTKLKDVIRAETRMKGALQVMVLPFEDYDTAEAVRLKMCTSCFVYPEDRNGNVKYIPVCAWEKNKKIAMKKVAELFNKPGFNKGLSRK